MFIIIVSFTLLSLFFFYIISAYYQLLFLFIVVSSSPSHHLLNNIIKSCTMDNSPSTKRLFLVIADSHVKYACSNMSTSDFHIITYSISGLQWSNPCNSQLSVNSLISQSHLTSLFPKSARAQKYAHVHHWRA